jgi:aspartate racemase
VTASRTWRRVIGIVGGLGPHAHLELEREILRAVDWAEQDQDYPEWVLASVPRTPDRTDAILHGGDSPVPWLARAIDQVSIRADFAIIACVTAHAFLAELRQQIALPVLDIVEEAIRSAHERGCRKIGVLATSGTLDSEVFDRAAARIDPPVEVISLLDLPEGESSQRRLVMGPVYDPDDEYGASLKTGGAEDPALRETLAKPLREAVGELAAWGAEAVVMGCTEIPLALGHEPIDGVPLVDPMRTAARAAVEIARGRRDLPPW